MYVHVRLKFLSLFHHHYPDNVSSSNTHTQTQNFVTEVWICNTGSYNMGTSALPGMYARSPTADGIHSRQSMSAHVITNMLHFTHS